MSTRDENGDLRWRYEHDDGTAVRFEILIADPAEARQLERHQAQVIREVSEWVSQQRSAHGEDRNE